MFAEITIDNFKCFGLPQTFHFSKVNVFSGFNGRGKSTVLQSLLLVAQSYYKNDTLELLETKGNFCNLGLFVDLLSFGTEKNHISFSFKGDKKDDKELKLVYREKDDRVGRLSELWIDKKNYIEGRSDLEGSKKTEEATFWNYPKEVEAYFKSIRYISANRQGPTIFEVKDEVNQFNPVGVNGEHILNMIAGNKSLQEKISSIVSRIMDGGEIDIIGDQDKNIDVLSLFFKNTFAKQESKIKSINFGFGYTYVLPIIIAASTMTDGILIIENPEAHLHPRAQSKLIKELVLLANENNVQLFIESHSEHIVNAVRLCTLCEKYKINNNDVKIYFFGKDMSVKLLKLSPEAQISEWPYGFFDQQEKDVAEILRLGLLK